ncbi:MAG TPA: glycerate kinase, partial [Prolixibacteraceae bacterium]|nr:glycerate kinase [Prolixibacteraceae bacterium]
QVFDLSAVQSIYVIGAGKASALMAQALESVLGSAITGGHIVTKYGHSIHLQYIGVSEAGHPVPDENGLKGTEKIIEFVQKADKNDLVICLISGGGSALLTDIPEGCTLADLASLNDLLLKSGAEIGEINCVRKHLSAIKGGQLAKMASPAIVISLILSDVIGDPLDVIASGPTATDESTFTDAMAVLKRYNLSSKVAPSIFKIISEGAQGKRPETLKKDDPAVNQIHNFLIGNNKLALQAAKSKAENLGFYTQIETSTLSGNVEDIASMLVDSAIKYRDEHKGRKSCLLYGGEPTVKISGNGLGGRNQHLALLCAKLLHNHAGITILSGGTDGTDGPTDVAGAVVDNQTFSNAKNRNLDINHYLQNCDSYHFFKQEGGLVTTGPTQTNVMDIILVLIGSY